MACDIYNLIILDRSGSMSSIAREAVNGLNETIGSVRSFARRHRESKNYLTLVSFCSCSLEYVYTEQNALDAKSMTQEDFRPCCCTPLNDTIGSACTRLMRIIEGRRDVNVSVTIITDGYENASKEWTHEGVRRLIENLRAKGWLFSYIGADHDVEKTAGSLSIPNHLEFVKSEEGTSRMFAKEINSRQRWMEYACAEPLSSCDNDCYFVSDDYSDK